MQEKAQVVDVTENDIVVMVKRQSTCQSCQVKSACGTSVLSKVLGNKYALLTVSNSLNAEVGDEVTIAFDDQLFVFSSFLMYLAPLLLMFTAAFAVTTLHSSEGLTMLVAFTALILSFVLLSQLVKQPRFLKHFKANLVSVDKQQSAHFSIKRLS